MKKLSLFLVALTFVLFSCKPSDEDPKIPTVVTMSVENVADITADVLAEVADDGGADILERGVCLNTEGNPQVTDICVKAVEDGMGGFTIKVSDLEPQTTYYVRAYAVNSVGTAYGNELSFTTLELDGTHNGYKYVDLGLSVKWAVCNVGAETPEGYGDYFAWGEIATKETYTENNCSTNQMDLEDISGNPQYDAARANWGGNWRMPTYEELNELYTNCTWTWAIGGYNVTGPNGNSIFMPATGARYKDFAKGVGEHCIYWSSTPYSDEEMKYAAYILAYSYEMKAVDGIYRYIGSTIRPVID